MTVRPTPLRDLVDALRDGRLDRRAFMHAATALGVSGGLALSIVNHTAAQDATPAAPGEVDRSGRPAVGTENQQRGQGGELRLISWQAASVLAAHNASGDKDAMAGSLIMEPLLTYAPDGRVQPILLESVPSVDDGTLSEDLTTATLTFLPDLLWSDGEPVTANDLVFTWQWVTNPANATVTFPLWDTIANIEATDDRTAVVTFKEGRVNWYDPFVGSFYGIVYPAHVFDNDPNNPNDAFLTAPIGTGPYKIDTFAPNDVATYVINENYREPNKPYFSKVTFKGGGDAVSSARAVAQTGEFDYAWNVQAEPEIIAEINDSGDKGTLIAKPSVSVETLFLNFADPNTEVDGQRSEMNTPHPFLSDPAVRQAMALAIDRQLIAGQFYGTPDSATANVLSGNPAFESPNTSWAYDLEEANRILDEAGWQREGDVRTRDGVKLEVTYATSVNQVRQKTQQVIKKAFAEIGIGTTLEQVDAAIYFDSSAGNEQSSNHFYRDIAMWSSGPLAPISPNFMSRWYAGPDGENIAQKANGWSGMNAQRYQSAEYDELYEQLLTATTYEEAIDLMITMNDIVIGDNAVVPLVVRTFYHAVSSRLRLENMQFDNAWISQFDNIANWNEATD